MTINKKILFITESGFNGKVSRQHTNMRTDLAWMASLNAEHISLNSFNNNSIGMGEPLDLIILIIPKDISKLGNFDDLYNTIKPMLIVNGGKFTIMQEGPRWYFQDYKMEDQIKYLNILMKADFLFAHNSIDANYYYSLTGKNAYVLSSLIIEDNLKYEEYFSRKDTIIGGNFCSWYGGFDSYIVAREFETDIYAPSMGRKIENESMPGLQHLPYMNWLDWMNNLNNYKYAVHLMRTHAAGTFALNCAYWGIPCIGYDSLDTQMMCHPTLSVADGRLNDARYLANELKENEIFYNLRSNEAKENYNEFFTEEKFLERFKQIWKSEFNEEI